LGFKLAVNTRLLQQNKLEGIGRFAFENLKRMVANHPEVEFHFIFDRAYHSDFIFGKNVKAHVLSPPTRHEILQYLWFHIRLPKLLRTIKADAFFSPEAYNIPNIGIPSFNTQHDLGFVHRPSDLPKSTLKFYRKYFPIYSKNASKVFTVSEFSKTDLITHHGLSSNDIKVVYNGHEHIMTGDLEQLHEQPYFLYVGSLHSRKNILHTLKGFNTYKSKYPSDKQLIIVGRKMFSDKESEAFYQNMKFKNDVVFKDYVSDSYLASYYHNAEALINLSYFEGFGIPLVEAFRHQVPVIASNCSCYPEIASDAALLINPEDVDTIANQMHLITSDKDLRKVLTEKGLDNIKRFSWDKSAKTIMNTILIYGT
jgi:glycosyltransferase involved in cell wall biosynthesis